MYFIQRILFSIYNEINETELKINTTSDGHNFIKCTIVYVCERSEDINGHDWEQDRPQTAAKRTRTDTIGPGTDTIGHNRPRNGHNRTQTDINGHNRTRFDFFYVF